MRTPTELCVVVRRSAVSKNALVALCWTLIAAGPLACDRGSSPKELVRPERRASSGILEPEYHPASAVKSGSIGGVVQLHPGSTIPPEAALFLIAKGPGSGPPLAVRKLPVGPFPMPFEIGPENVMHQGARFVGPIFLGARVDADADAGTTSESDLVAIANQVLEPGASGVLLTLRPRGTSPLASGDGKP